MQEKASEYTLLDLAQLATETHQLLEDASPMNAERLIELQWRLNRLQKHCGGWDGVKEARVRWYRACLALFEVEFVQRLEAGEIIRSHLFSCWSTNRVVGYTTLRHFLTRSYLGTDFRAIYHEVRSLLARAVKASKRRSTLGLHTLLKEEVIPKLVDDFEEGNL